MMIFLQFCEIQIKKVVSLQEKRFLIWKFCIFLLLIMSNLFSWTLSGCSLLIIKVWWHEATLFVYFLYFTIYIHSFNLIHTIHLSVAIRQGLSPYLHRWSAQWENLPVVPSRESNSGLPYSKPTLYQLSNAAPYQLSNAAPYPTEQRRTMNCEQRRTTQLSNAAPPN
jgi:hypothetical protein